MLINREDRKKIITGLHSLWRYCRTRDDISLSLSRFSSDSALAKEGGLNCYECLVANNTTQHRWVKLLIDIYLKDYPVHPEGHYAYLAKRIYVRSGECQAIELRYNWNDRGSFSLNGMVLPPDDLWRGGCRAQKQYVVKALLLDDGGEIYEDLQIVQSLSA